MVLYELDLAYCHPIVEHLVLKQRILGKSDQTPTLGSFRPRRETRRSTMPFWFSRVRNGSNRRPASRVTRRLLSQGSLGLFQILSGKGRMEIGWPEDLGLMRWVVIGF